MGKCTEAHCIVRANTDVYRNANALCREREVRKQRDQAVPFSQSLNSSHYTDGKKHGQGFLESNIENIFWKKLLESHSHNSIVVHFSASLSLVADQVSQYQVNVTKRLFSCLGLYFQRCFYSVQGYIRLKCLYAYMKICIVFCSGVKHIYKCKAVLTELFLRPPSFLKNHLVT